MQYSGSPYPYQGGYYVPRASMPHNPSPLVNTAPSHGGYPGMTPGGGGWGSTHHPSNQPYGTSPLPSHSAHPPGSHYPVPTSTTPHPPVTSSSTTSSSRSSKQSKNQPPGTLQPPKPPEKPLTPYMRYNKEMWDVVKTENPDLRLSEASKIIGNRWKMLSDKEKQKYGDDWEAEKAVYTEQMKVYHGSPAYKAYLEAKRQQDLFLEAKQQAELAAKRQQVLSPAQMGLSMAPQPPSSQEDEECELVTMRQVAGARYQRNHRLMAEIFSDTVVPDPSSASESKSSVIQDKVAALSHSQKDLEAELKIRETNFRKRKKQLEQDGQVFLSEIKRLRENPNNTVQRKQTVVSKIPSLSSSSAKYVTL